MARNLARSSSGTLCVLGQLEHPLVEREPGQLAVEEPVGGEGLAVRVRLDRGHQLVHGSHGGIPR